MERHGGMEKIACVCLQLRKQTTEEFLVLIQKYLEFRLSLVDRTNPWLLHICLH